MTLECHHFLLHTDKTRTLLVDQFFHEDWLGLTRPVTPPNRLEFGGWIPRGCCDVDPRRLLEVETLSTTLNLNDEYRTWLSFLETLNLFNAFILGN